LARSKEWERAVDRELQQDERQGKLFDPDEDYERDERAAIQMYGGG
jgi:hypothetical protein